MKILNSNQSDAFSKIFEFKAEAARRSILISPVITDLVHYTNAQLRIEYSLTVSEQLQGYLDYFLYTDQSLIIIEAKKGDLEYGFNQLAVQLMRILVKALNP